MTEHTHTMRGRADSMKYTVFLKSLAQQQQKEIQKRKEPSNSNVFFLSLDNKGHLVLSYFH